jgi:hypothetical protein
MKLILDTSDPAVAEMIAGWEEGGVYRIELMATQGPAKGSLVEFDVDEITDYGDATESAEPIAEPALSEDGGGVVGNRAQIEKIPIESAG